jgi:hypothetical protein
MEDIAGLGKIVDSKVVARAYEDAASPAAKEFGAAATDFVKTLRLFTAPFQLAAVAQDRFSRWLDEARNRVPPEKQVEAPPVVSGPALRAMLFMENENPMAGLFINLLSQAINRDTQKGIHPGFVTVLEQMNPDEALLLTCIQQNNIAGVSRLFDLSNKTIRSLTSFPQDNFIDPDNLFMYFEHLQSLCLIRSLHEDTIILPEEKKHMENYKWYGLSAFGTRFLEVCGQIRVNKQ